MGEIRIESNHKGGRSKLLRGGNSKKKEFEKCESKPVQVADATPVGGNPQMNIVK